MSQMILEEADVGAPARNEEVIRPEGPTVEVSTATVGGKNV